MKKHGVINNSLYLFGNIWKESKLQFLLIFLLVPATILMPFLQAFLPKVVIDGLTQKLPIATYLQKVLLVGAGLAIAKMLLDLMNYFMEHEGQEMRHLYRLKRIITSAKMDYEKFAKKSTLEKMDTAADAVMGSMAITAQAGRIFSNLLVSIFGMISFVPFILQIQPFLLVIIFMSFAINCLYGIFLVDYTEKIVDASQDLNRKLEYLSGKSKNCKYAKDIRLYKLGSLFFESYKTYNEARHQLHTKLANARFLGNLIAALFVFLRDGLAYFYLIRLALTGKIPIAEFVFLFPIITSFSEWLMSISEQITDLREGSLDIDYYREYLSIAEEYPFGERNALPEKFDIELKNVCYRYEGAEEDTLQNINLHIKANEKLAIVGVNGAGKTTLINLIMNFFHPTSGEIFIGGVDIRDFSEGALKKMYGAVFQDIFIPPETVKNIICCSQVECNKRLFEKAVNDSGFQKTLLELPNKEDTYLVKSTRTEAVDLSGGQQQRLMLARVLYKDAPVLILDEPTAALDPIAESEIYERYNEMTKNKTSIFISHRLASTRFCDRIILLDDGKIIEEGSHEELMKLGGQYKQMFDVQSQYYN